MSRNDREETERGGELELFSEPHRAAIMKAWREYANEHTGGMAFFPPNGICSACGHDCTTGWTLENARKSYGPTGCRRCNVSWCD